MADKEQRNAALALGQLVASRRQALGLTYRALSKLTGRSIGRLSDIVSGKRRTIPYSLAEKLATVLQEPKITLIAAEQRTIRISRSEYDRLTTVAEQVAADRTRIADELELAIMAESWSATVLILVRLQAELRGADTESDNTSDAQER